jgi:hypothetical protein
LQPAPDAEDLSPENQEDTIPKSDGVIIDIPNSITLWDVTPRPDYAADVHFYRNLNAYLLTKQTQVKIENVFFQIFQYFHFTLFAMSLNQILPNVHICPTDSR